MRDACREWIRRLDSTIEPAAVEQTTERIKATLESLARERAFALPEEMVAPRADCYARRLLHRDPRTGYTVVVMTWGPGQGTRLHDHAGMWCVECVVQGEMNVEQYELVEQRGERCRFEPRDVVRASVGDAGCLIPPFEYHVLGNARSDRKAVTLHVYAGEMDHCNLFVPDGAGWWRCESKRLGYD